MNKATQLLLFICLNILIGQVDYQTQIQTIFDSNCTSCHVNGGAYYGGLDLSTYANVMTGGNSGAVITPFDHANSYLWQRVNNGEMPPGTNPDLTASQVSLIALWIDEGALENPSIVQKTYVPDDNFEQALIDLGYDSVLDDSVLTDNISGVISLTVDGKEISNLTGIQDFTALELLYCENNQLTSLDLSNNLVLSQLGAVHNQLTSLDVSNNSALLVLNVAHSQLDSLDVSNNTSLELLDCYGNNLTYLNMKNGVTDGLTLFSAMYNSLECIETLDPDYATANWTYDNGNIDEGVIFAVDCSPVSINAEIIPLKFQLYNAYPNPFNPVTTLRYDLPENSLVTIIIYDMLGRQVKTLINQTQDAGYKSLIWNATNDYGKPVSAGIYLYQIQAGEYITTKKMVLLK